MSDHPRLFLVHWNEEEAQQLASEIQAWQWDVCGVESQDGARAVQQVRELQPDVLLIYLTRLPSHGRRTAEYVRSVGDGRALSIVFVGGKDAALAKTKEAVPDATYVQPDDLQQVLDEMRA